MTHGVIIKFKRKIHSFKDVFADHQKISYFALNWAYKLKIAKLKIKVKTKMILFFLENVLLYIFVYISLDN